MISERLVGRHGQFPVHVVAFLLQSLATAPAVPVIVPQYSIAYYKPVFHPLSSSGERM